MGASPNLQGYMAAAWGSERNPPSHYDPHTPAFKREWLEGYDEYKSRKERVNEKLRQSQDVAC